ncbi:protein transport protein SEC24 [Scheffersomyces amazonensis]|uniref:protein transport protein SEC24 n=1 Tax=Scheffersomyces amazonensis TaxID=1078765 RepID=UPI00315DE890
MSSRRRAYPQPQYALDASAPPSALTSPLQGNPYQFQQQPPVTGLGIPQQGSFDHTTQEFQNIRISRSNSNTNSPYVASSNQFAPFQQQDGPNSPQTTQFSFQNQPFQQQNTASSNLYTQSNGLSIPLNQLYTTDLSRELPPPISDLALTPPPIVLPPNIAINPNSESSNASPDYFRSTLNVIPNSSSLLKKSKLPLALILKPYRALTIQDEDIPVTSDTYISRCRRCKGYINPFVSFVENGRRWRCNFCNLLNDIPSNFEYDEISGQVKNKFDRVELNHAVVEFLAPKEYMVRTPPPIVYTFIIDVSVSAVQSGLTGTITRTILESLDRIPNTNKTAKVAFIGVDSSLHYFRFNEGLDGVESLIVSDIEEPFLPAPEGLLINLDESRPAIERFLLDFPTYFEDTSVQGFALGPALKAGHKLISNIGGKLICFTASLPSIGEGKLSVRDEASVSGKPKEAKILLSLAENFYKSFAVQCNSSQVTVDLFLTSSAYQDVATLSNLPRYTAGQTHFYPAWTSAKYEDVTKLSKEVSDHLSQDIAMEAVLKVRGSIGFSMNSFYGNFFNRSSDLCSFPTFPRDQSYCIEISMDETITKPVVFFQAAILHSTSFGERRVRLFNLAIPISSKLNDIYASADQLAITNFYTHKAIEKALASSLPDARNYLSTKVVELLNVYKKELVAGNVSGASPLQLSTNLRMLPLLLFSLTKHLGFRAERVPSDHRASALNDLGTMPINQLVKSIYPTVYALHDMPDQCGLPERLIEFNEETGEEEEVVSTNILLPEPINATKSSWENYGLYLVDNSSELFLWISGNVVPGLIQDLFGTDNLYAIATGKTELPEFTIDESEFNYRVRQIIGKIRDQNDSITWKNLYVVIGGCSNEPIEISQQRDLMALRMWTFSCLVEDKNGNEVSYRDFLTSLKSRVSQ